jgi:hypothetical protein
MNPSKNCLNSVAKFADIESSMFLAVVRVQTDNTCGIRRVIDALPSCFKASTAIAKAAASVVTWRWLTRRSGQSWPTFRTVAEGSWAFFSGGVTTPSSCVECQWM